MEIQTSFCLITQRMLGGYILVCLSSVWMESTMVLGVIDHSSGTYQNPLEILVILSGGWGVGGLI